MTFKDHLLQVRQLHDLIRTKATGTPESLARKLNISRATVFRRIDDLRALDAEIDYDRDRMTYYCRIGETGYEYLCFEIDGKLKIKSLEIL